MNSHKGEMGLCAVSFTKILEGAQDLRLRKNTVFHISPKLTLKKFSFKKSVKRLKFCPSLGAVLPLDQDKSGP